MHFVSDTAVGVSSRELRHWGRLTTATTAVALALLVLSIPRLESLDWGAIGIMSALGLGTGLFAFQTQRRMYVSFSTAVYTASIVLFGPHIALWVVAVTGVILEAVVYRRPPVEAVRSLSVRLIAVGAAGIVYVVIGGRIPPASMSVLDLARYTVMFATYGLTSSLVSAAAGLRKSWSLEDYGQWLAQRGVVVEIAMLPLSMLMVACYTPGEPATFPLLAIVLIVSGAAARSLWDTRGQLVSEVSHLELLTAVGALAARSMPLKPLVEATADLVRCMTGARQVRVVVLDDAAGRCEAVSGNETDIPGEPSGVGEELVRRVLESRVMMTVEASRERGDRYGRLETKTCEARAAGGTGGAPRPVEWVAMPLMIDDRLLGVLAISCPDDDEQIARRDVEYLDTLASQIARALESAALREEVERKSAEVEEWNRVLEQRVEKRTARLSATERELAVLNADLERRVKARTMELSEVQTRMVQSGRLAAVGELAAGVAHELNNPLGGILGYVQYDIERLERWRDRTLEPDERQALLGHMRMIESATQRSRNIVSNLLAFAEAAGCSKELMSLNDAVRATLRVTADQLRMRGIDVRVELDTRTPNVVGSPIQLQHVFMNIVVNARNAMESGGILTIRTGVSEETLGRRQVFASFEDTGHGIPGADIERVWEPFFTTREVGRGTGLGLSVSYGIVREHRGEIEIESVVGEGTTFTVHIPAAPEGARAGCATTRMEIPVDRT